MNCAGNNPNCVAGLIMMIKYSDLEQCQPCLKRRTEATEANKKAKQLLKPVSEVAK